MGRTWRGSNRERRGKKWTANGHNFGHDFEDAVECVLQDMIENQLIDSFVHHPPYTPRKDFTIVRSGITKEVNITTSNRVWKKHYERFGTEVEIIYFPPKTTEKEIQDRILQVFS